MLPGHEHVAKFLMKNLTNSRSISKYSPKDKVAVVTGANNPCGIGAGVAKAVAAQRAKVFLHYFPVAKKTAGNQAQTRETNAPGAAFYYAQQAKDPDEVLQDIRYRGGPAHPWEADLSDPASIPALFDEAERALGPVEVLVNNAVLP